MSNNNNYDASYSSYYEQNNQCSIERAVLAEDVTVSAIDNVEGKFFIPIMTPTQKSTDKATVSTNGTRSTSNYVTLNIPGYMLFQFMNPTISKEGYLEVAKPVIPKGTVFLVEFLGGEFTIEKTSVVGLLTREL